MAEAINGMLLMMVVVLSCCPSYERTKTMQFILYTTLESGDPMLSIDAGELYFDAIDVYDGRMTLHLAGSNTTAAMGIQGEGDVSYRLVLDIDSAACVQLRKALDLKAGKRDNENEHP